jgi:NAD(P)-dependent dehydrogenase (short-subunit alcohol dehydrogenase family)
MCWLRPSGHWLLLAPSLGQMQGNIEGKVAVITGAGSGIGFALAARLSEAGAKVVLADVERRALETAADSLRGRGAEVLAVATDVSDATQVEALAAATIDHYGEVHIVCNNAGVGSRGLAMAELPIQDYQWVLGVNLFGVIHGINSFLPHLRAQDQGHIINTASIAGLAPLPGMGPYSAAKAGVVALSETLHMELQAEGSNVDVSVLCPGWVRTGLGTSDRNRPEALAVSFTSEQAQQVQARRETIADIFTRDAIDPDVVADLVFDAITERRFYVFTHPEMGAEVAARFDRINNGEDPMAPKFLGD